MAYTDFDSYQFNKQILLLMRTISYVFTRNDDNSMNLQAIGDPAYENQMMDIRERDVDNNYCELNVTTAEDHTYSVPN